MNKQVRGAKPEAFRTSRMFPRLTFLVLLFPLVLFANNLIGQCATTISDFSTQHIENFENGPNALWSPITTSTVCTGTWATRSGRTPSNNFFNWITGPDGADQGNSYVYTEASSGCSNTEFILNGPCFDFTKKENAIIVFDYHMYGNAVGRLGLEASTDNGASWTEIWFRTGNQSQDWQRENFELSAYHDQTVQLRFYVTTGNGWQSDIAIDRIRVSADDRPCAWIAVGEDIYYECDQVGIGTDTPTRKLDVRGITNIGDTESRNFLEIKSDVRPEIQFHTPTSPGDIKVGVAEADDTNTGVAEGDFYVQSATAQDNMPLIVTKSGNVNLVNKNGSVGIGTNDPGAYKLAVEGTIGARKVKVTTESWADYVFEDGYNLLPLSFVEAYIKEHGHLPNVVPASEVISEGIDLGDMNVKLLEKIEELTLYIIEQDKRLKALESIVKEK